MVLPEREQSRMRKDHPKDITDYLKKRSVRRVELNVNFLENSTSLEKNNDMYSYLIGVFLVQKMKISDICNYITRFEYTSIVKTYQKIIHELKDYAAGDVESYVTGFRLNCPITLSQGSLNIPVKGSR